MGQKLRTANTKTKKLHKLILDAGMRQSGPNDEDIQKRFSKLRFQILQLVKKYCTNHNATPKERAYSCLNDEAKDFWVMAVISRALYDHCFEPKVRHFGFDSDADQSLHNFFTSMEKVKTSKS